MEECLLKAEPSKLSKTNLKYKLENIMNLKRAFIIALAACVLPGVSMAQDGAEVRFHVTKNFTDGNTAPVTVELECNDGFISQDGKAEITDDGIGHTFIVSGLTALSEVICEVTEGDSGGYDTDYLYTSTNHIGDPEESDISCLFYYPARDTVDSIGDPTDVPVLQDAVMMGRMNFCSVINTPLPASISVTKEWDITNSGGNQVNFYANIRAKSSAELAGGYSCYDNYYCKTLTFEGENPAAQSVTVLETSYLGTTVTFSEDVEDSYVETENSCGGSVTVHPGQTGASCAYKNSVFFEGIPTLSQYGMAIMALLMLGVGFVGFRRFV
jgi:hypothetical protein